MKTVQIKNLVLGSGRPKVAVPITGKSLEEIAEQAQIIAQQKPDMVEWRIDFFKDVKDKLKLQAGAQKLRKILGETALLVTFRTQAEGGELALDDDDYFKLIHEVIQEKIGDAVDLERYHDEGKIKKLVDVAHENEIIIIMSNHDFEKTPSKQEIIERLSSMVALGADIAKIAVMPNSNGDVLTLLQATKEAADKLSKPLITMSMGNLGKVSRISGEVFGSALTFASVTQASAPGQIELAHLRQELEDLKLS